MIRQPKGTPNGGQYAPDLRGKTNIPQPNPHPQPTEDEYATLQHERDDSLTIRAVERALMQMAARQNMPANLGEHGGGISYNSTVLIEWANIGEGWNGDYDDTDPDDTPLLRYYAYIRLTGDADNDSRLEPAYLYPGWGVPGDSSYCTSMPADTPQDILNKIADHIANELADHLVSGWRRTAEDMSHAEPAWVTPN